MTRNFRPPRWATLAVMALSLAACAKMFTSDPRPLYRLTAPTDFASGLPPTSAQIVIALPYAPEGLEPRRIAVVRATNGIDYLADGDWADRTPAMIRALLVEAFENSKSVGAVGPDSLDLRADF